MILQYSVMNMKMRYKGTHLGLIWAALEPLFMFVVLHIVFTTIRETREDFAIYLISGLLMFHLFVRGTNNGLSSIRDNASILKFMNIPKEFFPVASLGTICLFLFVHLGVLFGLMPIFNFVPPWTIVFLPIPFILLLLLILGISYFFSILNVYIRDIQPFWGVIVFALLFATPIFWHLDEIDGVLLEIHKINPLGQLIEIFHKILFGSIPPLGDWLYASALVFGILIVGYAIFHKYSKHVVEEL